MTAIRGLKQEIERLKNIMESPDYGKEPIMHPSEDTRIHWTREYLERAKLAYAEAGGTYTLSKSEEKTADFDANMDAICKITFIAALIDLHIGEWCRRYSTKRFGYTVCDGTQWGLEFEYNNGHKPVRFHGDNSYPYNFNKFLMLFGIDDTEEDEDE
ncbi:hypothetical protein [Clostridium sp. HMP27]|uniref:hypothetical protein n=1 Tax=Clostridium sp. HMP27 TaxID=1487921 RepID=UPI000A5275E2|nr:hypothetical protein [Clostridium sp. HMP27]